METRMLTIPEYAARVGKSPRSVRQKCLLGHLPGAVNIGRDWMIPEGTQYTDGRVKSGKYKDYRKQRAER